ncbi:MAG: hypothetical protein OEZ39_14720 [Gammaproteobacteria bacterium]|nr:hypothetical protein [Gammaproteobacteria bacterium]MDH5653107.1 hypothetical protein [Gammaproteobacteria bacterium]
MMNLPLKLRKQTEYCTPKGPSVASARPVSFSVEGTQIQLRAPRHSSGFSHRKVRHPSHSYNVSSINFTSFSDGLVVDDSWRYYSVLYRSWGFYGPWFTGLLAEMDMSLTLLTPKEPKAGVSFFHPRAFEQSVGDFITFRYSNDIWQGKSNWIAPLDWQAVTSLPCAAARFDVMPDQEINPAGSLYEYLFFPISDQYLVEVRFKPIQLINESLSESDKLIDRSSMAQLRDDIINSLQITLSPAAAAQQAKALEGLTDSSLRKEFPPMKWTTPEQDAEWEAYIRDM